MRDERQHRKVHRPQVVDRHACCKQLNHPHGRAPGVVAQQRFEVGDIDFFYSGGSGWNRFERDRCKALAGFRVARLPGAQVAAGNFDYAHAFFTLLQPSKSMEHANHGSGLRSAERRVAAWPSGADSKVAQAAIADRADRPVQGRAL